MKLEISIEEKSIKLLDKVLFGVLYQTLKKMFPDNYREFGIDTNTTIVDRYYPYYRWDKFWYGNYDIPNYTTTTGVLSSTAYNNTVTALSGDNTYTSSTTAELTKTEAPKSGTFIVEI